MSIHQFLDKCCSLRYNPKAKQYGIELESENSGIIRIYKPYRLYSWLMGSSAGYDEVISKLKFTQYDGHSFIRTAIKKEFRNL